MGKRLLAPPANALVPQALETDFDKWHAYNREMLGRMFSGNDYVQEYDMTHYSASLAPQLRGAGIRLRDKVNPRLICLESILGRLDLIEEPETAPGEPSAGRKAAASGDVFVVHGHDLKAKAEVARFIERAGLSAIILHEQPNAGRTIIEKFEAHGNAAGFAVILLTPDDIGGEPALVAVKLRPRARQNVIAEMGWFAGRLGRSRVCVLKKGDVEVPSDFDSVAYTDMDDRGAWKAELARELEAAGFTVDWSKAMV